MTSDKDLDLLIAGLRQYARAGVRDPWLLSDGRVIEPLDVLCELRALRRALDRAMPHLHWANTHGDRCDEVIGFVEGVRGK